MKWRCGVLLLALPALIAAGCAPSEATGDPKTRGPNVLEVEAAEVGRLRVEASLDLAGTLLPIRSTTIVSEVDGVIRSFPASDRQIEYEADGRTESTAIPLTIGQEVRQGDVLAEIDPTDFELALKLAEANLKVAEAERAKLLAWTRPKEVERLRAQLKEAVAGDARCRADLERAKQLLAKQGISQAEYDAVVMAAAKAAAAKEQAQWATEIAQDGPTPEELAVAEARVEAARAQVALKKEKLESTKIRAPYDGVITEKYVHEGERVTALPRVEILELIDPSTLFAEVPVPERYQGMIKPDDTGEIRAAGVAQPISGVVDLVNDKVDAESRTFRVRITIDNHRRVLKAGGFVEVNLPVVSADALAVPLPAVTLTEGRPAVFVYRDGHVQKRPVTVGISNRTHYEIVSGLSQGERVVVRGTSLLADGAEVRLKAAGDPKGRRAEVNP